MTKDDILGRWIEFDGKPARVIALIDEPSAVIEFDAYTQHRRTIPQRKLKLADIEEQGAQR